MGNPFIQRLLSLEGSLASLLQRYPFFRHRHRLCEIPIRCIPVNRMRTNGGEEYGIMLLEPFTKDF